MFIQCFALAFLLLIFQCKIQGKLSNTNSRLAMTLFLAFYSFGTYVYEFYLFYVYFNFILSMVWGFIWICCVQMSIFENYLLKRIFCLLNHIEYIYQGKISKTEYMIYFESSIFSICLYFYLCTSVIYDLNSI